MSASPARLPAFTLLMSVLAAALLPSPAAAETAWPGRYRAAEGPDVAGGLELRPDGRFVYGLSAGALDEQAQGTWRKDGAVARLTTAPVPVPPEFVRVPPPTDDAAGPWRLLVTWPGGAGIAGIDFRLGFAAGEPVSGYTQEDGWTLPAGELREPRWIELREPVHGIASPRFALAPRERTMAFVLMPNDLGVVAFAAAALSRDGKGFVLAHPRGVLRLSREGD